METSGFPYFTHVNIIHAVVAIAGAIVVVAMIFAISSTLVAAAPLKPYQANHKIKHPSAPIVIL